MNRCRNCLPSTFYPALKTEMEAVWAERASRPEGGRPAVLVLRPQLLRPRLRQAFLPAVGTGRAARTRAGGLGGSCLWHFRSRLAPPCSGCHPGVSGGCGGSPPSHVLSCLSVLQTRRCLMGGGARDPRGGGGEGRALVPGPVIAAWPLCWATRPPRPRA